jgi:metal-dependent amidase/aminoacylase/carboxypeptidase family protein
MEILGGDKPCAEMIHNPGLIDAFKRNSDALGRPSPDVNASLPSFTASTDMGNVSHAVPSIHPMIGIDSYPAVNHQRDFAAECVSGSADRAVYEGALAMAWTAIDCGADPALRARLLSKK